MKGRSQKERTSPGGLSQPVGAVAVASGEDALGGTEPRGCGSSQGNVSQTKLGMHYKHRPICRFYMSSYCKFGRHCKFYHPRPRSSPALESKGGDGQGKLALKGDVNSEQAPTDLNLGIFMEAVKSRPPVTRPERVKCKTPADLLQVSASDVHLAL